jgi:hypothetical protein
MASQGTACYGVLVSKTAKQFLERVASWPEEDQEELAEIARDRSAPALVRQIQTRSSFDPATDRAMRGG